MEEAEKPKSPPDHTVLHVDPQSSPKPKRCPEKFSKPISEGHHHHSEYEWEDEQIKEETESESEHINEESESEEEAYYWTLKDHKKKRRIRLRTIVKWAAFMVVMACLVSSLTIPSLSHRIFWGLELWKWFLMVFVIFCGRLFSKLLVWLAVFLIEKNFMLREKVLYFVYGLRRGVQMCVWLALVLLAWTLIFDPKVQVPRRSHKLLNKVTRVLIAILVGSIIWLVKIVLVKMLASWFHFSKYFDRMKESIFHQYILDNLSGPPFDEVSRSPSQRKSMGRDGIDMEQLRKLSRGRASTWGVNRLMSHVRSTALFTTSKHMGEVIEGSKEQRPIEGSQREQRKISSEWKARRAAQLIFKNVALTGARYIEEDDLLKFLKKEEVQTIFPLFQGAETGKIGKSGLGNWVMPSLKSSTRMLGSRLRQIVTITMLSYVSRFFTMLYVRQITVGS